MSAPPAIPRFAVVELAVQNMARSLDFYSRLGLRAPEGAEDQPHVEALLPGGLKVVFDTVETIRSFDPEWPAPEQGSRGMSLAFECESPAGVDQTWAALVRAGYESRKEPWDAFWGMRYAVLHDPDGNAVDLFALLPLEPADAVGSTD